LRNFKKYKWNNIIFETREQKFNETKAAEEYWWVITGGGAVMLLPIRFQCVGVWISS
jgi:hypothetical protein